MQNRRIENVLLDTDELLKQLGEGASDIKDAFVAKLKEVISTDKVKELLRKGNDHYLEIHDQNGHIPFRVPVTAGIIGAIIGPLVALVGLGVTAASRYKVVISREATPEEIEEMNSSETP